MLAMVTIANRDHAGVATGRSRIPGRVRSCDNGSSGACEARAVTSLPRSGGSGLYAPPRGHDQGRAGGRWPRGAPVPLARLLAWALGVFSMTPRGRPGRVPIQTGAAQGPTVPENARPVGCREAGAEAQTLIQSPSLVVLGSAHRCASLVGSGYEVGLTAASVGGERGALERGARGLVKKVEVDALGYWSQSRPKLAAR